ncbi:MAG: prepilin-type N-terminal cleavage/methylation domain-containing protein [Candidatus Gracilibacteria bacterium]|nr:prepilin-type N-terminal cleavage/methylation domain-containing protein [Candidatus Gracilibacteria bacterium]
MNKKGETLLEVLIALTIVAVSAAAAASAIVSANKGLALSKNYMVAQNLASEGLEIVKNIRDTNWMKFPLNKKDCWLNLNVAATQSTDCAAEKIEWNEGADANNDYYIEKIGNRWTLGTDSNQKIDNLPVPDKFGLKLEESQPPASPERKYTPISSGETAAFYRGIRVLDLDTTNGEESLTIQVIVKWYEGAKLFEIQGTEILTNYL